MERLSEKEWKQFGFAEVFDIKKGFYNKKPEDDGTGTIPFLGATDSNNGVTRFLTLEEIKHGTKTGDMHNSPLEKKLFPGHAIAVTNNGSVGHAFYQATKFTCSHDINPLYLRDHEMSREEADFLIKAIEEQGILFQYARKWRPIRMVKSKIMLPIDDKGDPDYAYMTLYSTEVGGGMLMRYKNFIAGQLSQLEHKAIPALEEKEWDEFVLDDIFTVGAGKRLETRNKTEGTRPFIGATDNGNGVTGFVGNDNTSKDSNVLGVNYNGAPCIAFYHPYECIFTDDVKRLHLKNHIDDKYVLLFFTSIFAMQRVKYSYGYKFKEKRMHRQKLMLPVSDDGKPDYEYMEQYAKNMMLRKYEQYLAFIDRQSSTEEVNV